MTRLDKLLRAIYRKDHLGLIGELASGSEINALDSDGRTPLMHAILASDAEPAWVQGLLELGAETEIPDRGQGWTALHFAARDQKLEIVRMLLIAGALVDAKDNVGNTPLWRATMNKSPNPLLIDALLGRGADPDAKNCHGISPRDLARRLGHRFFL